MKLFTSEEFLGKSDRRYENVDLSEFGYTDENGGPGGIRIRSFSAAQVYDFQEEVKGADGKVDEKRSLILITIRSAVNDKDELMFSVDDIDQLLEKQAAVLIHIGKAAMKLNGIDMDEVKETAGN